MSETHVALWEAVRRALGRLVSAVQVRELPSAHLSPSLQIFGDDSLSGPACGAGRREGAWAPTAEVVSLPPPAAGAGAGDADMAAVAVVVGLDSALRPEALSVLEPPPLPTGVAVHRQDVFDACSRPPTLWDAPVVFVRGAAHKGHTQLAAPAVALLTVQAPCLPKRPLFAGTRMGHGRDRLLSFTDVRVRSGVAACAEAPLTRLRRPAPPGLRVGQAFAAERRQLAQTAQADLGDVVLLGVYPQVPVAAVRRLALDEDGRALSLWLKPEALSAAAAGRSPRLVTLIVGRQRSTGRMIQAVG